MLTKSVRLLNPMRRMFSSSPLLVPLQSTQSQPPAEIRDGMPMTEQFFEKLQEEFDLYNEKCVNDLKEMNQNRITAILERNGVEGWDEGDNLEALTRTFNFDSFEQANFFMQQVGKFAETKDHHPEWSSTDGGKTINVRLTSHFAGNKVTLFDFELAEHMNKTYKASAKFNMFPRFDQSQLLSVAVGAGSLIFVMGAYTYLRDQHKVMSYTMLMSSTPMNQLEGESAENHAGYRNMRKDGQPIPT